jgi:hypothetical protein
MDILTADAEARGLTPKQWAALLVDAALDLIEERIRAKEEGAAA